MFTPHLLPNNILRKIFGPHRDKKVTPLPGSIVLCDLFGGEYHSGIYVGGNKIVHLEGSGDICKVSPEEFLKRLGGLTDAKIIYISCDKNSSPISDTAIVERALNKIGSSRDYNLLFDNCHQFTYGCITGDFENPINFTWFLKNAARTHFGIEKWLVWADYDGRFDQLLKGISRHNTVRKKKSHK